ncbi:glycosyltransferase family 39 protein [Streptomyces sp. 549]|uniref:glycosyltransferase family 39 protein n=1 Tax=Streptomyces sp. 549 TaxID=3049076 RepID=UPI0024C3C9CE|nr:glycosyltransferase family 39 protein [Streptomyces sp. 549]MDK1474875.1 glycosyltransferase family 39 protein [Streptomyces sp. 549]
MKTPVDESARPGISAGPAGRNREKRASSRWTVAVAPVATALALGWWGLGRQGSLWRDEAVTAATAQRELGELWALVQNIDAVHGLYYLLMHGWVAVCGTSPAVLRLPSVLATAVAAAAVAALGARLVSRRAGMLAGIVHPLLPLVQHHAQEARATALVSACVVWATYFFVRAVENNRFRLWAAYAALALLGCWFNFFALLALAAHALALWRAGVSREVRRAWVVAAGVVAVGVLPLAAVAAGQADEQLGWLSRPGVGPWSGYLLVAAAGALLCAAASASRPGPGAAPAALGLRRVALTLLVVPPGVLLAVSMVTPRYVDRYVLYAMAGLALLLGAAATRLTSDLTARSTAYVTARFTTSLTAHVTDRSADARRAGPRGRVPRRSAPSGRRAVSLLVALAAVVVLVPWHVGMRTPEARKDDAVAVADTVRALTEPGDAVLFAPARRRDWLLHDRALYGTLDDVALRTGPGPSGTLRGVEYPPEEVRRRLGATDRVVTLSDPEDQPLDATAAEATKRDTLDRAFRRCGTTAVHGARVSVWARDCALAHPLPGGARR